MQKEPTSDLLRVSDAALQTERDALPIRIAGLEQRVDAHRAVLEVLEGELEAEQRLLREIEELMDASPQMRLERLDRELRGQRIQEVAVEILRKRRGREPVHYREWYALVRAEGFEIAGRDPLNTFLTGIGRAAGVARVGNRTGLYHLVDAG